MTNLSDILATCADAYERRDRYQRRVAALCRVHVPNPLLVEIAGKLVEGAPDILDFAVRSGDSRCIVTAAAAVAAGEALA